MLSKTKLFLKMDIKDFNKEDLIELQKLVKYHNNLYYLDSNPIISDKEYDELFKKLSELEKVFNIKEKITNFV
jgi:DNA ligase (NAD+)